MKRLTAAVFTLLLTTAAQAATPADLDYIVNQVLEREGALFVTYSVDGGGRVSVLFGANEPEWRVRNTVKALQSHPDIAPDFFWARIDSEFCAIR